MQQLTEYCRELKKKGILPHGFPHLGSVKNAEDFRNQLSTYLGLYSDRSQAELLIQLNYRQKRFADAGLRGRPAKRLFYPRHGLYYFGLYQSDRPELFLEQLNREITYQKLICKGPNTGKVDLQLIIDTLHHVEEEPLPLYRTMLLRAMIQKCRRAVSRDHSYLPFSQVQYRTFLFEQKRILEREINTLGGSSAHPDDRKIVRQCRAALQLVILVLKEEVFIKLKCNFTPTHEEETDLLNQLVKSKHQQDLIDQIQCLDF